MRVQQAPVFMAFSIWNKEVLQSFSSKFPQIVMLTSYRSELALGLFSDHVVPVVPLLQSLSLSKDLTQNKKLAPGLLPLKLEGILELLKIKLVTKLCDMSNHA